MRTTFKALAVVTIAASTTSAQGLGDHLRIHGPMGIIEGQLVRTDSRSLVLDQGKEKVVVPRARVDSIFRRESRAKGAAMGFGIASAIGGGLFMSGWSNAMCGGGPSCGADAAQAFGAGAVAGGLLGALGGAVIGSSMPKWTLLRR